MKNLYKDLVFRFIDRMNDPCEGADPAEKILKDFVTAFEQVWRVEKSMTQENDDGGVEEKDEKDEKVDWKDPDVVSSAVDQMLEQFEGDDEDCPHTKMNISGAGRLADMKIL